jgi:hypothetical protein
VTVARISVRRRANAAELIAHELEHVIEYTQDVKFLLEALSPRSGVKQSAGAFETRRAIDAGDRVAQEVRAATRAQQHETKPAR